MPPRHLRSLLRLMSRRTRPANREATASLLRKGAGIVDREAFQRAWDNAMPCDAFNATHYQTKG